MFEENAGLVLHNIKPIDIKRGLHTICRIAISKDFLDIVLPNPLPSEVVDSDLTGFRIPISEEFETL